MRYYIIAGEASGDLHGSNLIKALRKKDNDADVRCWGGDRMEAAGAEVIKHYRDLAFMGFVEVIMNLRTITKNLSFCKKDILYFNPDVLVLIDYPGFNLRIMEWAKKEGIKIVYYISPQVWAWKENRVKKIKQCADKMLVILPFEKEYYKSKWDYDVTYVGHPLTEVIEDEKENIPVETISDKPVVAILPGSRKQEISVKLPIMLEMVNHFPQHQFVVAQAPSVDKEFYNKIIGDKNVIVADNQTYNLLKQSKAALVTSGTATLETALFGVPEVVCYKGNAVSFWLATKLVNVKYISLVNLIMDKDVVTELIQEDFNKEMLLVELTKLLEDSNYVYSMQQDYDELWNKLGKYNTSEKVAEEVYALAGK